MIAIGRTLLLGLTLAATIRCAVEAPLIFTAAGDYGSGASARATLALIRKSDAAFHLALGDFSYQRERASSEWCELVASQVGRGFPFLLVSGNHEDDFGGDGHISEFASCLPDRIGVTGHYGAEYYFDRGTLARFILISPDLTINREHYYYGEGNDHIRWLAAAIDDARAKGIRWVIVGMHKSCVSLGPYYCNLYSDLWNLLVEKRVDVTLHAHDHTYQRSRQFAISPACPSMSLDRFIAGCVVGDGLNGVYQKGRGTVSVTVGTGGGDLYKLNSDDPDRGYMARWMGENAQPSHGVLRVRLSQRELEGEFVSSDAKSPFRDRFVIQ